MKYNILVENDGWIWIDDVNDKYHFQAVTGKTEIQYKKGIKKEFKTPLKYILFYTALLNARK